MKQKIDTFYGKNMSLSQETCSCRPVHYFGTLLWDDIMIFWDENLLLFTFLTGKLRKPVLDQ